MQLAFRVGKGLLNDIYVANLQSYVYSEIKAVESMYDKSGHNTKEIKNNKLKHTQYEWLRRNYAVFR